MRRISQRNTPARTDRSDARDFATQDQYGQVDINQALGRKLEAVAYAAADFNAAKAEDVELRVGTENACRVWLNGQMLLESPAYHSLPVMDQFIGHGKLHAGRNTILVKLCQNEQTEEWARGWQFQFACAMPQARRFNRRQLRMAPSGKTSGRPILKICIAHHENKLEYIGRRSR